MALAIIVPNQSRTYTTDGFEPSTVQGTWAWVGLTTPTTSSGCVTFYRSGLPAPGREMVSFALLPGDCKQLGPFSSEFGVCWSGLSGGSAFVWWTTKKES